MWASAVMQMKSNIQTVCPDDPAAGNIQVGSHIAAAAWWQGVWDDSRSSSRHVRAGNSLVGGEVMAIEGEPPYPP